MGMRLTRSIMHDSSMREMFEFSKTLPERTLRIGDIGSRGKLNYRAFFSRPSWVYLGADLQAGENVNMVLPSEYKWDNIPDGLFDVVVSGQCLEHVGMPWLWIKEVVRTLAPGGQICLIAPHSWEFHPSPRDCWRVWPDGMKDLMEWAGLEGVKTWKNENDTVGVANKHG